MSNRRLGIAGYMGSGKSTCARILAQGTAVIIDADREAKEFMAADEGVRQRLVRAFGGTIIEQGRLSFRALGRIVFASRERMLDLNAIVHPPLVVRLERQITECGERDVILDAALIPLWGVESWFDECLWVSASAETRLQRLRRITALSEDEIRNRMRIQEEVLRSPEGGPWKNLENEGSQEKLAGALRKLL